MNKATQVNTQIKDGKYVITHKDLGVSTGNDPESIPTTLGNGKAFALRSWDQGGCYSPDGESMVYVQFGTGIELHLTANRIW